MEALFSVQNAIDYMEDHLFDELALARIAEAACMSVPNLYRVFYSVTGHPVKSIGTKWVSPGIRINPTVTPVSTENKFAAERMPVSEPALSDF